MFDSHTGHQMEGPPNTLRMGSPGPFGTIEMAGMFTVLKVREGITNYNDPGWYENPPGTVSESIDRSQNQKSMEMEMDHSKMPMKGMDMPDSGKKGMDMSDSGHHEHQHGKEDQKIEYQSMPATSSSDKEMEVKKDTFSPFIQWLGNLHPIFLHFPIALIVMTAISELLFLATGAQLFDQASRFMIISAAITAVPTTLFGLAFGYDAQYDGVLANVFWWHRFLGIFTTLLTIVAAILRELHSREKGKTMKIYYICLAVIFISVNLTGFLGGEMTFGLGHLWPSSAF